MSDHSDFADAMLQSAWAGALKKSRGVDDSQKFITPFGGYAEDPVRFIHEILGKKMWAGQAAIPRALMKHKRVVVRGPRRVGKSFITAATAAAFVCTAPTRGLVMAPGEQQIRDVIFSKIRALHAQARARLPGVTSVQGLRVAPEWYLIGVAAGDPNNVRGFHSGVELDDADVIQSPSSFVSGPESLNELAEALRTNTTDRLLLIFEEAIGIEPVIYNALQGSMSADNVYVVMLANPLMSADCGHPYANAFKDGSGWWRIHISAEEPKDDPTPSDECFHSVPEKLLPKKWIEEMRLEHGESSPLFRSDVLGCFTDGAIESQIIPLHILEAAAKFDIVDDERARSRHVGCDIAASESAGADWCVATLWINGVLSSLHRWKSSSTMHAISILESLVERWGPPGQRIPWCNVHIDATAIGKGPYDRLREKGLFVDGVNFGSKARYDWRQITGEMKFRDRKGELYWVMRRVLQEGIAMIPKKYQEVWRELQWHTHDMRRQGGNNALFVVETKDKMREKYGRSPDSADAAVLAWSRSSIRPGFYLI